MPNTGAFWFTPLELLEKIKQVDGSGSGLDADTVDSLHLTDLDERHALSDLTNVSDNIILEKIKNVDGAGSGLDADYLHGKTFLEWIKTAYQVYNVLGPAGLFETDSNGDGVADGWNYTDITEGSHFTPSLTTSCTEGSHAQYIKFDSPRLGDYIELTTTDYKSVDLSFNYTFFGDFAVSSDYNNSMKAYVYVLYYDTEYNNIAQQEIEFIPSSSYNKYVMQLNIPDNTAYLKVKIHVECKISNYPDGNIRIDNLRIIGIKNLDFTNPLVQMFFGSEITSLDDLMTSDNITNLYGETKSGYDWIIDLAGYGEGLYTRYFGIRVNLIYGE